MSRRSSRRSSLAATTAALLGALALLAGPARAADPVLPGDFELRDLLAQLPGLVTSLVEDRAQMLRCPDLAGGTIGTPESAAQPGRSGADEGNPLRAGDPTSAPAGLPDQVVFRTDRQSFNRRYQFAVADGTIWYKSNTAVTGIVEPWAHLPVPACFEGKVAGLSADDDELIAVDTDRWVYGLDGALRSPTYFNWSMRWGNPFWTGPGLQLPTGTQQWAWSVVSQLEDVSYADAAGNQQPVGAGKVSHIWVLNHDGQRLTYLDPWLPRDLSYEACGPHRGRFRSAALSASGSELFIVGHYGDLYTRLYDFDVAGADPLFYDYSYEDQRGVAKPKIQLPSPDWVQQPKIPGTITDLISVHKEGAFFQHRILRVEGVRDGQVGYWHKDLADPTWQFTRTGGRLQGHLLPNPQWDTSAVGLAPSEDRSYTGTAGGARITVADFNTYCTPAQVQVELAHGQRFTLLLHTVDNIRQVKRARGLDATPRMLNGTLEIPSSVRQSADAEVRAFAASLGDGRFVGANLDATLTTLKFRHQPWTLQYDG
jgi:hypothetical protein